MKQLRHVNEGIGDGHLTTVTVCDRCEQEACLTAYAGAGRERVEHDLCLGCADTLLQRLLNRLPVNMARAILTNQEWQGDQAVTKSA